MPLSTMLQPWAANASAIAAPMPLVEPVTNAVLPLRMRESSVGVGLLHLRQPRPIGHLHPRHQLVAAIRRTEDPRFAFGDIRPVLAESSENVGQVRDNKGVGAGTRRGREHRLQRRSAARLLFGAYVVFG